MNPRTLSSFPPQPHARPQVRFIEDACLQDEKILAGELSDSQIADAAKGMAAQATAAGVPVAAVYLSGSVTGLSAAGELDFERAENLATEQTTPGLVRSQADMLWKIHFRGSSRHLLLPVEFQSATERYMSVRALCHIALAYNALISAKGRRRKLAPGGMLPPTLAVTIYNGRERWAAPDDIFDLIEPVRGWLAGRQPRLWHQVLDLQTLDGGAGKDVPPWSAGWRARSSVHGRQSDFPGCWTTSPTRRQSPASATGSSNAKRVRNCWSGLGRAEGAGFRGRRQKQPFRQRRDGLDREKVGRACCRGLAR